MFKFYQKLFSFFRASFDYSGRAPRKDYWFFLPIYILMFFAAFGADVTYYQQSEPTGFLLTLQNLFGGREPFVWLHFLLFTPPLIAVTARRLHDRGRIGWWCLLYLLPVVGWLPLFVMMARRGQEGFNRFGTDPLALAEITREDAKPAPALLSKDSSSSYAPAE